MTRGIRLSPRHSEALNGILVEFSEKRPNEKNVLDAWQLYMNHLNQPDPPDINVWQNRADQLLVDLIYEMGQCLGFDFPKAKIQKDWYVPRYIAEIENENNELRKASLAVFKGQKRLKVETRESAPDAPPNPYEAAFRPR